MLLLLCCVLLILYVVTDTDTVLNLQCILVYSLRPIDVEFMKTLDKFMNIVPVIAKSDTMTLEEREAFKARVSYFSNCNCFFAFTDFSVLC